MRVILKIELSNGEVFWIVLSFHKGGDVLHFKIVNCRGGGLWSIEKIGLIREQGHPKRYFFNHVFDEETKTDCIFDSTANKLFIHSLKVSMVRYLLILKKWPY